SVGFWLATRATTHHTIPTAAAERASALDPKALVTLFATGFTSMAMEVVWTRQFTPYLGNSVYSFAAVLAVYLLASSAGSYLYRANIGGNAAQYEGAWLFAGALSLLPLYAADPYLPLNAPLRIALGLIPLCGLLGFLTPSLIDRWSAGNPGRAGTAYAVNIVGCILGPLIAGFLLLPWMEERAALALLSAPLFLAGLRSALRLRGGSFRLGRLTSVPLYAAVAGLAVMMSLFSSSVEDEVRRLNKNAQFKRDYQATVTVGGTGEERVLLVNGIGMTTLTPITKIMAHLPLAFLPRPPRSSLVICFGMGTTFRSLVSWGIPATAVELVPSVPSYFGFFHDDAAKVLSSPQARVVIDDGRRFLARSTEQFDVITVDPAPPMSAAGTSFLFSEEFYDEAKKRLAPDGIMQIWIVEPLEPVVISAFAKAIKNSFPYARVFRAFGGRGFHAIVSRNPIPAYTAAQLTARLPQAAVRDLLEMGPEKTGAAQFQALLRAELPLDTLILPDAESLRDDRPINEYFFLRQRFGAPAALLPVPAS
ncbi:MAG: fused MFS/spermidine synthase, partial [Elusimicrobiota bacterium]